MKSWTPAVGETEPVRATETDPITAVHSLAYMPGLDGIRGISIALVVGCHTSVWFMIGGGIGVDIFFVLSGFLISRVLIEEFRSTGHIDFVGFYWRRFLRIVPPLAGVCIGLLCIAPLAGISFGALFRDYSVTLTFIADYTRAGGGIPLYLAPTWSLAVEEQFYLLWPTIALGLLAVIRAPARIVAALVLVGAIVAVWRFYRFEIASNPIAVYDSFDARFDALCLGCAIAFLDERNLRKLAGLWPGAVVVLAAFVYGSEWNWPWMYFGGFSLVGVSAAILIAAAVSRNSSILSSCLEFGALRWLGRISYSLYLWHWPPLICLYVAGTRGYGLLVSIPIGIVCAILSTRFIERPASSLKGLQIQWIRIGASLTVPVLIAIGVSYVLPGVRP